MTQKKPGFIKMIRAPFFSSIISPLLAGTLLAVYVTGEFEMINFFVVLIMGVCLHLATNVYNDIYDTLQGTDRVNIHRNEFSGGSGVIVENPEILPKMYNIARIALIIALCATIGLFFLVKAELRIHLIILYLLSAFFSKYYTAAPFKLASRGLGEIAVWFAFGPMAIMVAAVSQNVGLHPVIIAGMPITGISTLSILLIGQIIDKEADQSTGKRGVAARLGIKTTGYIYLIVQLLLCLNIIILPLFFIKNGWLVLIALIPYLFRLATIFNLINKDEHDTESQKKAAALNVMLHIQFSLLFSIGLLVTLLFK